MKIQAILTVPNKTSISKTVELEVKDGMTAGEIVDWVYKNRYKILTKHCNLTENELKSAIANGEATIYTKVI
jgi:hypothetical protein